MRAEAVRRRTEADSPNRPKRLTTAELAAKAKPAGATRAVLQPRLGKRVPVLLMCAVDETKVRGRVTSGLLPASGAEVWGVGLASRRSFCVRESNSMLSRVLVSGYVSWHRYQHDQKLRRCSRGRPRLHRRLPRQSVRDTVREGVGMRRWRTSSPLHSKARCRSCGEMRAFICLFLF